MVLMMAAKAGGAMFWAAGAAAGRATEGAAAAGRRRTCGALPVVGAVAGRRVEEGPPLGIAVPEGQGVRRESNG